MLQRSNHQFYGRIEPLYKFKILCDAVFWMFISLYLLTINQITYPINEISAHKRWADP